MEYTSKIKIVKDKKIVLFNEEAVQSLNLDATGSKIIFVITLKDETEDNKDNRESSIYIVNAKNSNLESVNFKNSKLKSINFNNVNLENANFDGCEIENIYYNKITFNSKEDLVREINKSDGEP